MSDIFDWQGNKIGGLKGGIFGGRYSGPLFGQDGNKVGEVSGGGLFEPAPNSYPGDTSVFNEYGKCIGHISGGTAPFGGTYTGPVYDTQEHRGEIFPNTGGGFASSGDGGIEGLLAIFVAIGALTVAVVYGAILWAIIWWFYSFIFGWKEQSNTIKAGRILMVGLIAYWPVAFASLLLAKPDPDNNPLGWTMVGFFVFFGLSILFLVFLEVRSKLRAHQN